MTGSTGRDGRRTQRRWRRSVRICSKCPAEDNSGQDHGPMPGRWRLTGAENGLDGAWRPDRMIEEPTVVVSKSHMGSPMNRGLYKDNKGKSGNHEGSAGRRKEFILWPDERSS